MKFLYFLVTDCKAYADKLDAFKYFFEKEGGFTAAFLVALGVAFVFALIYYLFCFRSFSWAKTAHGSAPWWWLPACRSPLQAMPPA